MAIITAANGDIQQNIIRGIQFVQAYGTAGCLTSVTTQPPRVGLVGLGVTNGSSVNLSTFPVDYTYDLVPAVAGRTYFATAFEYSFTDISDAIGSEYTIIGKIVGMLTSSSVQRELRAYTDGNERFLSLANAGIVTTTTSLQDPSKDFVALGTQIGDWVSCNNLLLKVTSITTTTNPNDTLNGTAGWRTGGTPGNGNAYIVYSQIGIRLQVYDNASTPVNVLSQSGLFQYEDRATAHYIELMFAPSASGSPSTELVIDGAVISGTTGTNGDPGAMKWYYIVGGTASKTNHWHGQSLFYNLILWDNLTGAPTFSGAFATHYNSLATQRPYVSFLPPASGAPVFDAWTKSTGTDASVLVNDASTRPTEDTTTYVTGAGNGTKQAWKHAAISSASLPIEVSDTIYAVVVKGSIGTSGGATSNTKDILASIYDGTAETGTQATTVTAAGSPGYNPIHGVWEADSAGSAWTPTKLGSIQTVVKQNTAVYNPQVFIAGAWAVGKSASVTSQGVVVWPTVLPTSQSRHFAQVI